MKEQQPFFRDLKYSTMEGRANAGIGKARVREVEQDPGEQNSSSLRLSEKGSRYFSCSLRGGYPHIAYPDNPVPQLKSRTASNFEAAKGSPGSLVASTRFIKDLKPRDGRLYLEVEGGGKSPVEPMAKTCHQAAADQDSSLRASQVFSWDHLRGGDCRLIVGDSGIRTYPGRGISVEGDPKKEGKKIDGFEQMGGNGPALRPPPKPSKVVNYPHSSFAETSQNIGLRKSTPYSLGR